MTGNSNIPSVCSNSVFFLNCLLVNARSIVNKLDMLSAIANSEVLQCIFITETWATDFIPDSLLCPEGYQIFRQDRGSRAGGVLILLKNNICAIRGPSAPAALSGTEVLTVDIICDASKLRLILIYHPPVDSRDKFKCDLLIKHLVTVVSVDFPVVMLGDFNKPGIVWNSFTTKSSIDEKFLNFISSNGFQQMVEFPTKGENFLDLVFTNVPNTVCDFVCEAPLSDKDNPPHVGVGFKIANIGLTEREVSTRYRFYPGTDFVTASSILADVPWQSKLDNSADINDMWCTFKTTLNQVLDACVPTRPVKKSKGHYSLKSRKIKVALNKKLNAWRKYKQSNSLALLDKYKYLAKQYKAIVKETAESIERKIITSKDVTVMHR